MRVATNGLAVALFAGVVPGAVGANGAPATTATTTTTTVKTKARPAVDPAAIAALENMGGFLRALQGFAITAETSTDDVLASGQKVKYGGVAKLTVRRPDRLHVDIKSDRQDRELFYDGKTFTIYGRPNGYYASFDAPPTLHELVDVAERRYDIDMPLADLFQWGADGGSSAARVRSAVDLGPSRVDGADCDHYAFREPDVDWQIWIERGGRPLPHKLVITTTSERTQPEHAVVLTWDLAPKLNEQLFAFTPPADAHKIDFAPSAGAAAADGVPRQGRAGMRRKAVTP